MKCFIRYILSWFAWDRKPPPPPGDELSVALRETHRRKLEGFNQALAAATGLRELLRKEIETLAIRQASLRARLQAATAGADEEAGASLALELQTVDIEATELSLRLEQATRDTVELTALREEAIQRAQAELQNVSKLADQASLGRALSTEKKN